MKKSDVIERKSMLNNETYENISDYDNKIINVSLHIKYRM
jgi:hypothetical protein